VLVCEKLVWIMLVCPLLGAEPSSVLCPLFAEPYEEKDKKKAVNADLYNVCVIFFFHSRGPLFLPARVCVDRESLYHVSRVMSRGYGGGLLVGK
jgi:hypothetical protein